jgi:hypothetical protein
MAMIYRREPSGGDFPLSLVKTYDHKKMSRHVNVPHALATKAGLDNE